MSEMASDYLADTLASNDRGIGDLASIVSLALLESNGNHKEAFEFLERAAVALRETELRLEAEEILGSALFHLGNFIEDDEINGR